MIVIAEGGKSRDTTRLDRRFDMGPPVAVYLGGAKTADGTILGPTLASLPRPRPAAAPQIGEDTYDFNTGQRPTMATAFAAQTPVPRLPVADLVVQNAADIPVPLPRPRPEPSG